MKSSLSKVEIGNFDKYIEELLNCNPIPEADIKILCAKAKEVLVEEKNV